MNIYIYCLAGDWATDAAVDTTAGVRVGFVGASARHDTREASLGVQPVRLQRRRNDKQSRNDRGGDRYLRPDGKARRTSDHSRDSAGTRRPRFRGIYGNDVGYEEHTKDMLKLFTFHVKVFTPQTALQFVLLIANI